MVTQHCEYILCYSTIHLEMVKMINICIFYHNKTTEVTLLSYSLRGSRVYIQLSWTFNFRVFHKPLSMCYPSLKSHLKDLLRTNLLSYSHTWLLASSVTWGLWIKEFSSSSLASGPLSVPCRMDFFSMVDCFIKARNKGARKT